MHNKFYSKYLNTLFLFAVLLLIALVMSIINPRQFLTFYSVQSLLFQIPELGILTLAMMVPVLTGGINLSVIATANLAGTIVAIFFRHFAFDRMGNSETISIFIIGIILTIIISLICGLVNGFLIGGLNVHPVLATLGTMTFFSGIALLITQGKAIKGFPDQMFYLGNGVVFGLPIPFIIFIICCIFLTLILRKTALGLSIYMIGLNPIATKFSGINNRLVLYKTYLISGIFSGITSLIMISRFNSAKADYGNSYLLVTILVLVIGGVSINGGSGNVIDVFIAIVILNIISTGFNLATLNIFLTQAVWGLLLILVILIKHLISLWGNKSFRTN
ncbi:MAG: ABC transporter permease [Actinobacteria bacterium]|nr:ABC transporter permease [Cyanobacteriota bacterium]MCL5771119.1 ABC transporter permease [Actinomycetota bacterium]